MRALYCDGKQLRLIDDPPSVPVAPPPGEAIIKVRLAGVSPIDASLLTDPARLIGVPGHEAVGVVHSLNIPADAPASLRDRKSLVGKRVLVWPHIVCGHCELCRGGLASHCRSRQVLGVPASQAAPGTPTAGAVTRPGCLAERVCVPIANLHELPASVPDDAAIFGVTLARALQVRHLVRGGTGPTGKDAAHDAFVTVIGENLLAVLVAQVLSRVCPSVRVLGGFERPLTPSASLIPSPAPYPPHPTPPTHIRLLERWGIKHRLIDEAGRRQDQSVVIECTGTAAGFRLAMQHVRPRGTIILKSPVAPPPPFPPGSIFPVPPPDDPTWQPPIDLTPVVSAELKIIGSGDGSATEAVRALTGPGGSGSPDSAADGGEFDVAGLIARRFKAEHTLDALRAAVNAEPLKIVVEF